MLHRGLHEKHKSPLHETSNYLIHQNESYGPITDAPILTVMCVQICESNLLSLFLYKSRIFLTMPTNPLKPVTALCMTDHLDMKRI